MGNEVWRKVVETGLTWRQPPVQQMETSFAFSEHDRQVLRRLAGRVAEIAACDGMKEKIARWTAHNDLKSAVPVIYVDPENGWNEVFPDEVMECTDPLARSWEFVLRRQIFSADEVKDDTVVSGTFDVPVVFSDDGWGLSVHKTGGGNGGAFHIEPAIEDYETDFAKLHFPQITVDWALTDRVQTLAEETLGDLLRVRRHMKWHWAEDFLDSFVLLRGMEDFMCDFVSEPEWIDRVMTFLVDGANKRLDWLTENNLLFLNNDNTYVGTGGIGYTTDLPQKDFVGKVRTQDLWGTFQAQETVSVNPDMFGEHLLPHFIRLAERFGLTHYGCCEPFNPRWKYIKQIPHLRKVSVSAWADWSKVPEYLGKSYVASIKPSPAPLAQAVINEDYVRGECRRAVEQTYGGVCQFVMKDNHTLGNNPNNLVRWTQIMREEIERKY